MTAETVPGIELSIEVRSIRGRQQWLGLVQLAEASGFRGVLFPDRLSGGPSRACVAAAAFSTTNLKFGVVASAAALAAPDAFATDLLAMQLVTDGRIELHLDADRPQRIVPGPQRRESPKVGADPVVADVSAMQALMLCEAPDLRDGLPPVALQDVPNPHQCVPMTIRTSRPQLLNWSGAHADGVGLSGLGPTGRDGSPGEAEWSAGSVDRSIQDVTDGAVRVRRRPPPIEVVVQLLQLNDDHDRGLRALGADLDMRPQDLRIVPYVLVGSPAVIARKLSTAQSRWGISRWVLRDVDLGAAIQIKQALVSSMRIRDSRVQRVASTEPSHFANNR